MPLDKAEDRGRFKDAMTKIIEYAEILHLPVLMKPESRRKFPTLIRPFTMGGSWRFNRDEFQAICERGFDACRTA